MSKGFVDWAADGDYAPEPVRRFRLRVEYGDPESMATAMSFEAPPGVVVSCVVGDVVGSRDSEEAQSGIFKSCSYRKLF